MLPSWPPIATCTPSAARWTPTLRSRLTARSTPPASARLTARPRQGGTRLLLPAGLGHARRRREVALPTCPRHWLRLRQRGKVGVDERDRARPTAPGRPDERGLAGLR